MTEKDGGRTGGPLRSVPADLAAIVVLLAGACAAAVMPAVNATSFRAVLAVPFVLFVPGYALVAALFPRGSGGSRDAATGTNAAANTAGRDAPAPTNEDEDRELGREDGLTGMERLALSFGTSIAVVPLIGLMLSVSPLGIRLTPVLLAVAGFTLAMTVVAAYRRSRLPDDERLTVPFRDWARSAVGVFSTHESRLDAVLTVVTVVSIVLAVSSVGYAFAVPKQADGFTEFYIVTEQEGGELIADDYPTEFTAGESRPLVVGIGNHEHRTVEYTMIVELQRVDIGDGTATTRERETLLRRQPTVLDEQTWTDTVDIAPEMQGERLRLVFMLFESESPSDPTIDDAYRETHLWINVSDTS
jgi:uncharacterized membrane protein